MPSRTEEIYPKDGQSHHDHVLGHEVELNRILFFRIGALRFGFHGIFGLLSLLAVSISLTLSLLHDKRSSILIFFCVLLSMLTSVGSYSLLRQVPMTSKITSWIIPPHKDAFRRTIAINGYLNMRLARKYILDQEVIWFPVILFGYTLYHFFPLHSDFSNGNTWIFVFPIFSGLMIDCLMQVPKFNMDAQFQVSMDWGRVYEWNENKVDESFLLFTLLCTLQIAFMFTLAFRGIISIQNCYWMAAIEVGGLFYNIF